MRAKDRLVPGKALSGERHCAQLSGWGRAWAAQYCAGEHIAIQQARQVKIAAALLPHIQCLLLLNVRLPKPCLQQVGQMDRRPFADKEFVFLQYRHAERKFKWVTTNVSCSALCEASLRPNCTHRQPGWFRAEYRPWGSAPNPALAAWQGVGLKTQPHPYHRAWPLHRRQGYAAPGAHPFGARLWLRSACGFRARP